VWKHTAMHLGLDATFTADPARQTFLNALKAVGSYPSNLNRLGVANGRGDGEGLNVTAGNNNLHWPKEGFKPGATLYAQNEGTSTTVAPLCQARVRRSARRFYCV
jgi:hypothetical protein